MQYMSKSLIKKIILLSRKLTELLLLLLLKEETKKTKKVTHAQSSFEKQISLTNVENGNMWCRAG